MRLTDRIHLVGGGSWGGAGLSPNPDCHVYLVDGGDALALIDAGSGVPGSREAIWQKTEEAGFDPGAIEAVLVTHMHGDHMGGVNGVVEELGAVAYGSSETCDALITGDEQASAVALARDAGIYPLDFALTPTGQAHALTDGQPVEIGDVEFTAVATPGHCAGHVSYVLDDGNRRDLFSGDAVFYRGRVRVQAIPDCNPRAMATSLTRLSELRDLAGLLPGHGAFTLQDAGRHLAAAAEVCKTLRLPPEL